MNTTHRFFSTGRMLLLGSMLIAGALTVSWWTGWPRPWNGPPVPEVVEIPTPPFSETRFLNTSADARYIGSAACAKCHGRHHQSYLLTAHSRALSDLDLKTEPPDAAFEHKISGRSFRVHRADSQLRHEEIMRRDDGTLIGHIDVPVKYLIGSGAFARTYLVEIDGFLHESPITWYPSKKAWSVSPGYDFPQHHGFERAVRVGCVVCHAGRVETTEGTVHRLTLHEKAIGCESCHGPGSLHQDLRTKKKLDIDETDFTIVNPSKLPRDLQEAICAHCHASGAASVLLRGRGPTDYRPGRSTSDFRADFRFDDPDAQMSVVGHFEQMRLSRCYQQSKDMTCLTCHDPHQRAVPKDVVSANRKKCQTCHDTHPCTLPEPQRLKKDPKDNCVGCHMPRGDTEIPHIAFTHHRIGLHSARPAPARKGPRLLVPSFDTTSLSDADRARNLGLAYLDLARDARHGDVAPIYRERALKNLGAAHNAGLRDADTCEGLAELVWMSNPLLGKEYAQEALADKNASHNTRALTLAIIAHVDFRGRDYAAALAPLEELTRLRRFAEDWRLLGVSQLELKKTTQALKTLHQALAIRPYRHTTHLALEEAYRRLGDSRRAQEHALNARWLREHGHD